MAHIAVERGRVCRKCGADSWYLHPQKKYHCYPCLRVRTRKRRQDPIVGIFTHAKYRAKRDGVEFSITADDIRAIWPADNRCPALGIPLRPSKRVVSDASPTLDRLIGDFGYVPNNITILSHRANSAKRNLTADELERLAAWMRSKGLS